MRSKLQDTPSFRKAAEAHQVLSNPLVASLKMNFLGILQSLGIALGWNAAFYILLAFLPTYASTYLKLPLNLALLSSVYASCLLIVLMPIMGHLSDKIGRKPVLITSCLGFILFTYPLFVFMADGSFTKVLFVMSVLALFQSMISGAGVAAVAEIFKTEVRASSLVALNIGATLAGGMGPFFATYLIRFTGKNSSPAFYVMALVAISLVSFISLPETYNKPLK
jgi:MHS family proline/betaine transporter-like MFS transporter